MTLDDVRAASTARHARGIPISTNTILARIGGSKRDVVRLLRLLRAETPQRPSPGPEAPIPSDQAPAPVPDDACVAVDPGIPYERTTPGYGSPRDIKRLRDELLGLDHGAAQATTPPAASDDAANGWNVEQDPVAVAKAALDAAASAYEQALARLSQAQEAYALAQRQARLTFKAAQRQERRLTL